MLLLLPLNPIGIFLLFQSIQRFHNCCWYVVADESSADYLCHFDNLNVVGIHSAELLSW